VPAAGGDREHERRGSAGGGVGGQRGAHAVQDARGRRRARPPPPAAARPGTVRLITAMTDVPALVGDFELDFEVLHLPGDAGHRMLTYTAVPGSAAQGALLLLASSGVSGITGPDGLPGLPEPARRPRGS
jgi:hypothetical protein